MKIFNQVAFHWKIRAVSWLFDFSIKQDPLKCLSVRKTIVVANEPYDDLNVEKQEKKKIK